MIILYKHLINKSSDYLKNRKVVQLDDLGAHFNLKIHEVVERIETLQEDGTINGWYTNLHHYFGTVFIVLITIDRMYMAR